MSTLRRPALDQAATAKKYGVPGAESWGEISRAARGQWKERKKEQVRMNDAAVREQREAAEAAIDPARRELRRAIIEDVLPMKLRGAIQEYDRGGKEN